MQIRSIIKKRCVFIVLAFACVLAACLTLRTHPAKAALRSEAASQGLSEYHFDIRFMPEDFVLYVTMELNYINDTGDTLSNLLLRTYANAYQSEETSPAAIDFFYEGSYKNGFSPGALTIEGIWWNENVVTDWKYEDAAQTALNVPISSLHPHEKGLLRLRCRVQIPHCAHRFGYSEGVWQFGNVLPILALYQGGAWRQDDYCAIGDPFVSACANYTVAISAPNGYQCAASAGVTTEKTQDGLRFTMHGLALRDFAFVLSNAWQSASAAANGIQVTAYAFAKDDAKRIADYGAKALQIFSKLYGAYAWDQLTIALVDFPAGGMEYPGLIFLSQDYAGKESTRTAMELVIAHETAHQWFYAMVGSDQYNQPWQDEALSEYAMLQYVREKYGDSSYRMVLYTRVEAPMQERILSPVTPGSPVDYFSSYADYSTVVYGRGAALLTAIDEMTGNANGFLRSYCDAFAFSFATREDFDAHLNTWSGKDLSPLVLDYIDTCINN